MTNETQERKSIISEKYAGRGKEKDWLGRFIDDQAVSPVTREKTVKNDDGTETTEAVATSKTTLDLDRLFALCSANHIDTSKMEEQRGRPNAPGRIRMTLGNSLRAAARKRHGLFDIDREWRAAPGEWLNGAPLKENPDGTKVVVDAPADAAEVEAETEAAE